MTSPSLHEYTIFHLKKNIKSRRTSDYTIKLPPKPEMQVSNSAYNKAKFLYDRQRAVITVFTTLMNCNHST